MHWNSNFVRNKRLKMIVVLSVLVLLAALIAGLSIYSKKQLEKIPDMTIAEMVSYTLKDNEDGLITIGIIKEGKTEYTVYGKNADIVEPKEHIYEIGSLTKTFTGSLLCKAISEDKINLDDAIDQYIDLPAKGYYPTIRRMATHTSGYRGYYFETQMVSNVLHGRGNDFYGITGDMIDRRIKEVDLKDQEYSFKYSNFGIAVVGRILEEAYKENYIELMNSFVKNDLGLQNTQIAQDIGDLNNYWDWEKDDAYMPAGAIKSNITDMMKYINLHLTSEIPYLATSHETLTEADGNTDSNELLGIRIDAQGVCWMKDMEHNIIWHNGGTSNYTSYAGFDDHRQIGVVVLSNLSPEYRIPATVIGARLLEQLQNE